MREQPAPPAAQRCAVELAPRWHSAALVALIISVACAGLLLERGGAPVRVASVGEASRIWGQYLPLLIVNFALAVYCCRLFRARNALPALLGRRWHSVPQAAADLALALAVVVTIQCVELGSSYAFAVGRDATVAALLPTTQTERLIWLAVAVSVGVCEEIVYRGYLQTQLSAFTGRASFGIALQGALFGLAHAEQGPAAALRIAVYGVLLGALAKRRGSLIPGILAHVGIDLASAFVR